MSTSRPNDDRLRMGVIGLGVMGRPYARILHELGNAQLVAVADIQEDIVRKVAAEYGVEGYLDYRELTGRSDIDAVAICTPESAHLAPARAAVERRLHMLVEKPLANAVEEAEQIVAMAEDAQVRLMVGHILRFDPRYALAQESIHKGDLGEIIHIFARRSGLLAEGRYFAGRTSLARCFGVHDFDIIRWFTGSHIQRVYAEGVRKNLEDLGVDDTVICLLKLASGAIAVVELSWALPDRANPATSDVALELVASKGILKIDAQRQGLELFTESGTFFPDVTLSPVVAERSFGVLKHEISHFVDCVLNGEEFRVDTADATEALRVADAVDKSLALGRPIDLQ